MERRHIADSLQPLTCCKASTCFLVFATVLTADLVLLTTTLYCFTHRHHTPHPTNQVVRSSGQSYGTHTAAPWLLYDRHHRLMKSNCRAQYSASEPDRWEVELVTDSKDMTVARVDETSARGSPEQYYLSAVIFNRVFKKDRFNITARECKQWIEYMLYAGVEHIYWYDTGHTREELQEEELWPYVELGLMTYHAFYQMMKETAVGKSYHFEQDESYAHFLKNYRDDTRWALVMDVDEYPFSPVMTGSCFLQTLLRQWDRAQVPQRDLVSQVLLQCMIFGGNPQDDLPEGEDDTWMIVRYRRRKRGTEGLAMGSVSRQKAVFRASLCEGVTPLDPHMFRMRMGQTLIANASVLRMNHYWGARLSDFGPDTAYVSGLLTPDASILPIVAGIKHHRSSSQ